MKNELTFITHKEDVRLSALTLKINAAFAHMKIAFVDMVRDVGPALAEAKAIHLHKRGASWANYCETECNLSLSGADRLIRAARVYRLLDVSDTKYPTIPATESQCRLLSTLPDESVAPAWGLIIETCGVDITAEKVETTLAADDRFRSCVKGKGSRKKKRGKRKTDKVAAAKAAIASLSPDERAALIASFQKGNA